MPNNGIFYTFVKEILSGRQALQKWYQHKPQSLRNEEGKAKTLKETAEFGDFCKCDQETLP